MKKILLFIMFCLSLSFVYANKENDNKQVDYIVFEDTIKSNIDTTIVRDTFYKCSPESYYVAKKLHNNVIVILAL